MQPYTSGIDPDATRTVSKSCFFPGRGTRFECAGDRLFRPLTHTQSSSRRHVQVDRIMYGFYLCTTFVFIEANVKECDDIVFVKRLNNVNRQL